MLNFTLDDAKRIRKEYEPLYANHLQFIGKIIEAQKEQKILHAEIQARENHLKISKNSEALA